MTDEIPYMAQVGNVSAILSKIQSAGSPSKFTHDFLYTTLGFRGTGDRGVIKVLRKMGFLNPDNTPTARYNEFRSAKSGKRTLADGLREAFPEVFLADTNAQNLSAGELVEIFKSVSGKDKAVATKMASTFKAFAIAADWTGGTNVSEEPPTVKVPKTDPVRTGELVLHQDVHVHLPASSDVAVYTAIFRALKEELID